MGASDFVHPNIARYRRMIEAFNANDLSVVRELLAPEFVYTMPGRSPLAGRSVGVAPHLEMLRRARENSAGTLRFEPQKLLADDETLMVWGRICAERGGRRLDSEHCVLFRFRGGLMTEGRTLPVDLYEFDAFWS
jgi:ketosteroid isomerase-like protein